LAPSAILPGEEASAYRDNVIAIPNGHLVSKHRTTYPVAPCLIADEHGNALATLGFMLAGPKDLLASFTTTAGCALDDCEGEFVAVYADAAYDALHLVNDRFAVRPCYVLRTVDAVYFSTNVGALSAPASTGSPARPCPAGGRRPARCDGPPTPDIGRRCCD
jgi:hypothetical protein